MPHLPALRLTVHAESWPIAGSFTISRGAKTEARVVVATLTDGTHRGRGECVPYARYGETVEGVTAALEAMQQAVTDGLTRQTLQQAMPAGAARNALDCAFWDYAAKAGGRAAWELAGLPAPRAVTTAYTISLGTPQTMAEQAARAASRALLKVKLGGGPDDIARIRAVRAAAPDAELIVDANEAWRAQDLPGHFAACREAGVTLIEQPLPSTDDSALAGIARPIPVCADESVHARDGLAALRARYDAINIKLDKTGGLTEALALALDAERLGFSLMAGCMVATSLSMAPALLIAQRARVVDLDGPLLLARDRTDGLIYDGSLVHPPRPALWG